MNQTKSDIEGKPSRIDAPKGHQPPKALRPTPAAKIPKHRKRTAEQTLLSQIAYHESLPPSERGTLVIDHWPFDAPIPDFVRVRKKTKNSILDRAILPQPVTATRPKIKDRLMNAILNRIWTFVRDVILQWAFPFPIYKKSEDGVTPVIGDDGKPVIDWVATVSARVLSIIAVFWGTVEVLGIPIAEWVKRIGAAIGVGV